MELATAVWYGRYWYDAFTIACIVGFFLVEMVLLFRNSLIGWAMTAKCLVLAGVFLWAFMNPPPRLPPEDVTIQRVAIYTILIATLGVVILILAVMRLLRMTVVVGRQGAVASEPENPHRKWVEDRL